MSTQPLTVTELDTTAKPVETATSQATSEVTQPQVAESPKFTDADLEAYNQMVAAGITPNTYQQFVASKNAMDALPALIRTNPKALLSEIAKSDPEAFKVLTDAASDEWFQRPDIQEMVKNQNGQNGRASSTSVSDPRIDQLQSTINALVQERQQEKQSQQFRQVREGYDKTVDSLMARIPKEAALTEAEKEFIVLKTERLIASDRAAQDRVSKGVYVDVPKHFKAAVERLTADKKQSASSETARRNEVAASGTKPIVSGAENVNGAPAATEQGHADPIWGDISSQEIRDAYK